MFYTPEERYDGILLEEDIRFIYFAEQGAMGSAGSVSILGLATPFDSELKRRILKKYFIQTGGTIEKFEQLEQQNEISPNDVYEYSDYLFLLVDFFRKRRWLKKYATSIHTNISNALFLDLEAVKDFIKPSYQENSWYRLYLGCGHHLLVHPDVFDVFSNNIQERFHISLQDSLQKDLPKNLKVIIADELMWKESAHHILKEMAQKFNVRKELKNDKEVALKKIKKDSLVLSEAGEHCNEDKDIILAIVKQNGAMLEFIEENFQADKEIVLAAVSNSGRMLEYASESLRNDREIVLAAVSHSGRMLEYASESLRNDREIILAAVSNSGWALEYASESLRNDREIVLAAVSHSGRMLEYASESLRNDREIVLVAVSSSGRMLEYANESLQNDKEVVLAAVSNEGGALEYASESLQNDRAIVSVAVSNDAFALEYASESLQNDKEVVLAAVSNEGGALEYASESLQNDRAIVSVAVSNDAFALEYASESLQNDGAILLESISEHGYAYASGTALYKIIKPNNWKYDPQRKRTNTKNRRKLKYR